MSSIIKSPHTIKQNGVGQVKTIAIRDLFRKEHVQKNEPSSEEQVDEEQQLKEKQNEIEQKIQAATKQAEDIVQNAENYAKEVRKQLELEQAQNKEECEKALEDARKQGYEEGYAIGQKEGFESYNALIDEAKSIINRSEVEFKQNIDSAEPIILELATALAKRIIGDALVANSETWTSLVKQVMLEVREHEEVKLYVHPDWYKHTCQQKEELEQFLSQTEHLYIYPDAGLMKNGCVVESKFGRIDATLDQQLLELKAQLAEKLKEGAR